MILNPRKFWHRVLGRIRLFFGFCPRCNSSAPALDTCLVCYYSVVPENLHVYRTTGNYYPPNVYTKEYWWQTWTDCVFEEQQAKHAQVMKERFNCFQNNFNKKKS